MKKIAQPAPPPTPAQSSQSTNAGSSNAFRRLLPINNMTTAAGQSLAARTQRRSLIGGASGA